MTYPDRLIGKIKRNKKLRTQKFKKRSRPLDQVALCVTTWAVQGYSWTSYASNFSAAYPLCSMSPGIGYGQRGNSDTVDMLPSKCHLTIHNADTYVCMLRVIGITITGPYAQLDSGGIPYMPTTYVLSSNFASTNLWVNPVILPRDRNVFPFQVWMDTRYSVDCLNGHDSRAQIIGINVPKVQTKFTSQDTNGTKTSYGMQYLLVITDATTLSANFTHDFDLCRKFLCIK